MGEILMEPSRVLVLMYHQIEPAGGAAGWTPNTLADARYGVGDSAFREQMAIIRKRKIPVVGLGACLQNSCGQKTPFSIVLTFDDGYSSDLERAAPILQEFGFPATFFLSTGLLGKEGMLTRNQARELSCIPGLELGSHGVSHRFLSHLSQEECARELQDSFRSLADLSASNCFSLSAPGGRTSPQVAREAEEAGFRALCTSRPGLFREKDNRFSIPRLPVMKDMTSDDFHALLDPDSLSFRLNSMVRSSKNLVRTVLELPHTRLRRSGG